VNQTKVRAIRIKVTQKELEMAGWALAFAALTGIGAILKVSPLPEKEALRAIRKLLDRGVLRAKNR